MDVELDLILVDLDETLLSTDTLQAARHSRKPVVLDFVPGYDAIRLHDGVADSLDRLAVATKVGLVTSSPRWYTEQILAAHLPTFDFVVKVTYDDVKNIKPHPEPLLVALAKTGVAHDRAIYVGDADVDFDACTAAGVAFVGAGWADRPTFPAAAPSVRSPQELVELIGDRA